MPANDNANVSEKLLSSRAKSIYELIASANLAQNALSDQINDDIESSEDFDQHSLAPYHRNAYSLLRQIEQLLVIELSCDLDGKFKNELEKLLVLDVLKGNGNHLRAILNRFNLKK
jgi:hypothetical protein